MLWAVHISDGVLTPVWLIGGWLGTALLVGLACWRTRTDDVARVSVLAAAVFVASSIHLRLPPATSVHLLLNGLVGVLLGVRAPLAIALGLLWQALFLNHGGLTALGMNTCVLSLPALVLGGLFQAVRGWPQALTGFLLGFVGVALTAGLNCLVLSLGTAEDFRTLAMLVLVAHLPVALLEGVIVAVLVGYLAKVRPALLGREPLRVVEERESSPP